MENLEFLQDSTLQHTVLVKTLPKKVGQQQIRVYGCLKLVDLLS